MFPHGNFIGARAGGQRGARAPDPGRGGAPARLAEVIRTFLAEAPTAAWRPAAALVLAAGILLAPAPATAGFPSPDDWRDVVIYQIITDRYADGDPANNDVEGYYAPADGYRIHGGDFRGLEERLDYLATLGVNGIWISPVVRNCFAEYHGYAARDFFSIAPHFGSLAELRSLVDACHARGIYVILDVVVNHMGDLIDSASPSYPDFRYPGTYTLRWKNAARRYYGVLDDLSKFHAHGHIGSFTDPEQILGELFGLDDLKTELPEVQAELVRAAQFLIDSTDCDGFRLDTVKHTDMPFWDAWAPQVRAHAAARGKAEFFLFGEVFDGSDAKCGSYTGTVSGGNYKLDSVLYFPMLFTARDVFVGDAPPAWISGRYTSLDEYDVTSRERLVSFLDNHDMARFLSFGLADQDESRLRAALGWLLTARGVPAIYYGTEQEFDGGGDPWCREDMWDGEWDFGPSEGDNFDLVHPLFLHTRDLLAARARHEALRRGTTTELYAETAGPGLYVYSRRAAADTALVAVNSANEPQSLASVPAPWPPGTVLADALDAAARDTVRAPGFLTVRVPARSARVYESLAARQAWQAVRPLAVVAAFPGHGQALNDTHSPLAVTFDRDVDAASLTAGFAIDPAVTGAWQVAGRQARFYPAGGWSPGTRYAWSLDAGVRAADGQALAARFDAFFRTDAYATGIAVPAGYAADRIARQGLTAPEGLLPAPWIGPDQMLVSDTGRRRVFTLTPGGDLGHWVGDTRWYKPEGLVARVSDRLLVVDTSGIFEVDARRWTGQTAGPSAASATGAGAWGGGAFGDALFLCDPPADRVVRVDAGGTLTPFATGVRGGEGLAFGPGGAWGSDLYVADADLTSLGADADGPGRIARVDAAGAVTTLVEDPALLAGASALAFDTGGRFGGDLFVADILEERILRVTAAGGVSVFATGFHNLSGSHCLAFGPDGALYVADPGSGQEFSNSNGTHPPQVIRIARADVTVDAGEVAPARAALRLSAPTPNPARHVATLRFALPRPGRVSLAVFDPSGRRVRQLAEGDTEAGPHAVVWDGRDDAGSRVGSGLYFVRLATGEGVLTQRLVWLR